MAKTKYQLTFSYTVVLNKYIEAHDEITAKEIALSSVQEDVNKFERKFDVIDNSLGIYGTLNLTQTLDKLV